MFWYFKGDQHMGKHPTIYLDLVGATGSTMEEFLENFRDSLRSAYEDFGFIFGKYIRMLLI